MLLPDELMFGKPNCLAQMVEAYEQVGGNIVAALEVPDSETHKYGVIDPGATDGRLTEIRGLVEKPAPGTAPSNLMLPGRYILQPEVMRALDAQEAGAGGEIQLTDAMAKLIGKQPFHAYRFEGERYDCGSAAGFVIANLAMALERDDVAPAGPRVLSPPACRRLSIDCGGSSASLLSRRQLPIGSRARRRARRASHCRRCSRLNVRARSIRRSIRAISTSKWKGLQDHVVGAGFIGAHRASASDLPVISMIGMSFHCTSPRIARASSAPLIRGMSSSASTRSIGRR